MQVSKTDFVNNFSQQWGWFVLRGLLAVIFGVLCFSAPIATAWALAVFWGAFALVEGVVSLITAWRVYKNGMVWWPYLLFGLIGVAAGAAALMWPKITLIILLYLLALWAILGGLSEVIAAIRLRKVIANEWALVLSGIISIAFGILILAHPFPGTVAIIWLLGGFSLGLGILSFVIAWNLRKYRNIVKYNPNSQNN